MAMETGRVSFDSVREVLLALPGVEEGVSYGTQAFRVRGKFIARLLEDGDTLVVKVGYDERDYRMRDDSDAFFITDHYLGHAAVLICLSKVKPTDLREALIHAWRERAPKRLINEYELRMDS